MRQFWLKAQELAMPHNRKRSRTSDTTRWAKRLAITIQSLIIERHSEWGHLASDYEHRYIAYPTDREYAIGWLKFIAYEHTVDGEVSEVSTE